MTYSAEVLADSPSIYLHLDEASGTSAADSGSVGTAWTYQTGVTLGQADLVNSGGHSIACAGTVPAVKLASVPTGMSAPANFTLECVVNLGSTSLHGAFVAIGNDGSNGWAMGVGSTDFSLAGNNLIGGAEGVGWRSSGVAIGTGTHHVAITRDASGWYFYIDGANVANLGAMSFTAAATQCTIGGGHTGWNLPSTVLIDEAAAYITKLSGARIAAHYAAISGGAGGSPRRPFREAAALRRQAVVRASSY